jgi:hypothetical protein
MKQIVAVLLAIALFTAMTCCVFAENVNVRIIKPISGPNGSYMGGELVTLSQSMAADLVTAGYAVYSDGTWVDAAGSGNQSIATNTLVNILATTVTADLLNEFATSTGVFRPAVDGWYHVEAGALFDSDTATQGAMVITVYRNGSDTYISQQVIATGATGIDQFLHTSGIVKTLASETLTVKAWQSTGAARNISSSTIRIKRIQ